MMVTPHEAALELRRLEAEPQPLPRPVVVLNGYHGASFLIDALLANIRGATSGRDGDFLAVSYPFATTIEGAADQVTEAVNTRWPSDDPNSTVEVDVVAISMGGIVARWAALPAEYHARPSPAADGAPAPPARRLRMKRLFTLATPHRGAAMAEYIRIDKAAASMCAGSDLLRTLDNSLADADFELVCYGQKRDLTVGVTRMAPEGRGLVWTGGTLLFSHLTIMDNTIVLADIARRLRGMAPLVEPGPVPEAD